MTYYATCAGCEFTADCEKRRAIQKSIKGVGITSLKFRCDLRRDKFVAGQAVWFDLVASIETTDCGGSYISRDSFSGYVVEQLGNKVVGFVKPGTIGGNEGFPFEPINNGVGFVKVPLHRVIHRDAPSVDMKRCEVCWAIPSAGPCQFQPSRTEVTQ